MGRYEAVSIRQAPVAVVLDALNRAVRTWWGVSGAVLLVTLGSLGLDLMAGHDPLSLVFWHKLVSGAVTAVLASVFSYLARFKAPPPAELTPGATPADRP